jgi:hypothetical protein
MLAALAVALLPNARSAWAQNQYSSHTGAATGAVSGDVAAYGDACCDACCDPCCDPCCSSGGIVATAEATFFRYHRADGVRVGTNQNNDEVEFDFEISPRITVGWVGADGFGARVRWWDYDHTAPSVAGEPLTVDTYLVDVELFDTIQLNCNWALEVSGGLRFNEFTETMNDTGDAQVRVNDFSGFGGLVGMELKRCLDNNSALFVRVRGAILMDDKFIRNDANVPNTVTLLDSTQGMVELALGYEYHQDLGYGAVLFARATAEWQNWFNYSSAFEDTTDVATADAQDFGAPSDVGFGGFAFAVGVTR